MPAPLVDGDRAVLVFIKDVVRKPQEQRGLPGARVAEHYNFVARGHLFWLDVVGLGLNLTEEQGLAVLGRRERRDVK